MNQKRSKPFLGKTGERVLCFLCCAVLAGIVYSCANWYFELPTVYYSAETRQAVAAEDGKGKPFDLDRALRGAYEKVWIP